MKLIAATSLALFAVVAAATTSGATPPQITEEPVAFAMLHQAYSISVKQTAGLMVVKVEVPPGGSFGWHSHPSSVAVAITSGTLTLYDSSYPNCGPKRFSRGQGFVERPNHIHLARNEGTKPVTLYATYLGVPPRGMPNVLASAPANCPA
jgi:quercetin dioxygenase-like cupin family protein